MFDLLGLTQWIREPTYPRSGNTLDLILTSDLDRVGHVHVCSPLPGCDHCPTLVDYVFSAASDNPAIPTSNNPQRRAWHKGNYRAIRHKLEGKNWTFLGTPNASDGYDYLADYLNELSEDFVPMNSTQRDKPPWPTRAPTSLIHEKQRVWATYKAVRGDWAESLKLPVKLTYPSLMSITAVEPL